MDEDRRRLLGACAVLGAGALLTPTAQAEPAGGPIPPLPATPTPGKPGDFDWLTGEWRIAQRRKPSPTAAWDVFEGEATCWSILGGVCHIEELRIPARNFSGMGLRLLDVEKRVWSDHWVNAKSGVVFTPGQTGSFEHGAGVFFSEDKDDQGDLIALGLWDNIGPRNCRWRQAVSRDRGATWDVSWIMDWSRVR